MQSNINDIVKKGSHWKSFFKGIELYILKLHQ